MSEYTPGPWSVDDLGWDYFAETNHRYGIACDAPMTPRRVAKVEGDGPQFAANAKLISAAPEMAEYLQATLRFFEILTDFPNFKPMADAAIKEITPILQKAGVING